jgi:hypothetical protein
MHPICFTRTFARLNSPQGGGPDPGVAAERRRHQRRAARRHFQLHGSLGCDRRGRERRGKGGLSWSIYLVAEGASDEVGGGGHGAAFCGACALLYLSVHACVLRCSGACPGPSNRAQAIYLSVHASASRLRSRVELHLLIGTITEMNRIRLVLFDINNRISGP